MAAPPAQSEAGLKERFYRDFQREVIALQEQIERLNTTSPLANERNAAVDDCLAGIDQLSHDVMDASSYIPAYDQRTYSQTIKTLSEKLQTIRNSFNPPKRFSFKNRKTASATSTPGAVEQAQLQNLSTTTLPSHGSNTNSTPAVTPLDKLSPKEVNRQQEALKSVEEDGGDGIQDSPGIQRPNFANAKKVTISNHTAQHIVLPASAAHATSSGTVSNLQRCVVDLSAPTASAPFSALYLKNIEHSLIVCGRIAGAIHITNVENSVLVTSCRQFRMHGSKNVDIYLHSSSRPIIEDCKNARFAPLPEACASPELSQAKNQWDQIDDFKWLKIEPSPNFSLLAEPQRVRDEVWRGKVLGGEGTGLEDVLKAVNLR